MKTILATAYDINPYKGSEAATGWNFVLQIARFNKVIAITRKNNQKNIERYIKEFDIDRSNLVFCYYDLPYYLRFWKRGARGSSLYFYLWQMFMPLFVKKNKIKFDIAHNVNFHADAFPTFLWFLGKPLIWGPINHNEKIPKEYISSKKEYISDRLKWIIKNTSWNIDPFMLLAKINSDIIIGGNSSVQKRLHISEQKFIKMSQVASSKPIEDDYINKSHIFEVLIVGRFINIKSFDIAINAFDIFYNSLPLKEQKKIKLSIVGDGPLGDKLKGLKRTLHSKEAIEFLGWIDKGEIYRYFQRSSVFFFPSHEGAGMVVAEALSYGTPILCFENVGPGELVDDSCAIRVPYTNYEQSVVDFSKALDTLYSDTFLYKEKSKNALKLFQKKYTWDSKGEFLRDLYLKINT